MELPLLTAVVGTPFSFPTGRDPGGERAPNSRNRNIRGGLILPTIFLPPLLKPPRAWRAGMVQIRFAAECHTNSGYQNYFLCGAETISPTRRPEGLYFSTNNYAN